MSDVPTNGTAFRLNALERKVDRLEALEPAVVKAQVADIRDDITEIRADLASIRKILVGFLVTFAFTGITVVAAVLGATA